MSKLLHITTVFIVCVLVCTSVSAADESWRLVKITQSANAADNCTSVGMVHVSVNNWSTWSNSTEIVYDRLKKKAAEKDANLIVLIGQITKIEKGRNDWDLNADGEAFICGKGLAVQAAAERRAAAGGQSATPPAPSAAGTPCGLSFKSSGSMVRGTTYTAAVTFTNLTRATLFQNVKERLDSEQLQEVTSDEAAGVIHAQAKTQRGRVYPVDLLVSDAAPGARVGVTVKIPIGLGSDDDASRDAICRMLGNFGSSAPPSARALDTALRSPQAKAPDPAAPSSVEERLRRLEELHKKGVISDAEYKKKRAEILKDL